MADPYLDPGAFLKGWDAGGDILNDRAKRLDMDLAKREQIGRDAERLIRERQMEMENRQMLQNIAKATAAEQEKAAMKAKLLVAGDTAKALMAPRAMQAGDQVPAAPGLPPREALLTAFGPLMQEAGDIQGLIDGYAALEDDRFKEREAQIKLDAAADAKIFTDKKQAFELTKLKQENDEQFLKNVDFVSGKGATVAPTEIQKNVKFFEERGWPKSEVDTYIRVATRLESGAGAETLGQTTREEFLLQNIPKLRVKDANGNLVPKTSKLYRSDEDIFKDLETVWKMSRSSSPNSTDIPGPFKTEQEALASGVKVGQKVLLFNPKTGKNQTATLMP